MTVTHGMDTVAGRRVGDDLMAGADELDELGARVDALLHGFEWCGTDAERTREEWRSTARPRLVLASRHLHELAVTLQHEADAQDRVSGDESGAQPGAHEVGWLGAVARGLHRTAAAAGDLGSKMVDILTGRRDWSIAAVLASALGTVGAAAGTVANAVTGEDRRWFAESHAEVGAPVTVPSQSDDPYRRPLTPPTDTASLMQGVADAYAAGSAPGSSGDIRITRIVNADGQVGYVVAIPGTESWALPAESKVRDLTANLDLMAGRPTAAVESVREAMAAAGVPDGAHVLLVGHSQGGIIAGQLATDPAFASRYDVSHVLTFGAPIDHFEFADGTSVLQVQHRGDVVPDLDLNGDRAALKGIWDPRPEQQPRVTLPGPGNQFQVVENHDYVNYVNSVHTALGADGPEGAAIRQWQDDPSMAVFLVQDGDTASAVDVPIRRGEPR